MKQRVLTREEWMRNLIHMLSTKPNAQFLVIVDDPETGVLVTQSFASLSWARGILRTAAEMIRARFQNSGAMTKEDIERFQNEVALSIKGDGQVN